MMPPYNVAVLSIEVSMLSSKSKDPVLVEYFPGPRAPSPNWLAPRLTEVPS